MGGGNHENHELLFRFEPIERSCQADVCDWEDLEGPLVGRPRAIHQKQDVRRVHHRGRAPYPFLKGYQPGGSPLPHARRVTIGDHATWQACDGDRLALRGGALIGVGAGLAL